MRWQKQRQVVGSGKLVQLINKADGKAIFFIVMKMNLCILEKKKECYIYSFNNYSDIDIDGEWVMAFVAFWSLLKIKFLTCSMLLVQLYMLWNFDLD